MKSRTDSTHLPSALELKEIIARESHRNPDLSKLSIHYPDFSTVIALFEKFKLPTQVWKSNYTTEDLYSEELIIKTELLIEELARKILGSKVENYIRVLDKVFDYLSEEDSLEKADFIFVFGNRTYFRIDKAIEVYKKGFAPKLIISGNAPIYSQDNTSEAAWLRQHAIEEGIPEESIIVEEKSLTLADNVKRSLDLLDKMEFQFNSIILVNHGFSQRRGWCYFKKFLPNSVKLIRVNSNAASTYTKEGWYTSYESIRVIINEFMKMKVGVALNTA